MLDGVEELAGRLDPAGRIHLGLALGLALLAFTD
jgi:hypothetical protein